MAKLAAESEGDRHILPFSISCTRLHVRQTFKERGSVTDRPNLKSTGKLIAEALDRLEKGQAAAIFQLRSGHCPLNHYLARIGVIPSNRCQHCGRKETTTHYLLYCPKYSKERRGYRNKLKEAEIKLDTRRAHLILDSPEGFQQLAEFILSTGRFDHLRQYVEL